MERIGHPWEIPGHTGIHGKPGFGSRALRSCMGSFLSMWESDGSDQRQGGGPSARPAMAFAPLGVPPHPGPGPARGEGPRSVTMGCQCTCASQSHPASQNLRAAPFPRCLGHDPLKCKYFIVSVLGGSFPLGFVDLFSRIQQT